MLFLNENETIKYNGGGKFTLGVAAAFAALGAFIFGIIDGFMNPKSCNLSK